MLEDIQKRLQQGETVTISVRVHPGAKTSKIVGFMDDGALKVDIKEAPESGEATEALRKFLASAFGVPVSHVEILAGQHARTKVVRLQP